MIESFSYLETIGVASKRTAELKDQAEDKFDEVSSRAQKAAKQAKKGVKDALDL
jgi:hypothetical protein